MPEKPSHDLRGPEGGPLFRGACALALGNSDTVLPAHNCVLHLRRNLPVGDGKGPIRTLKVWAAAVGRAFVRLACA